RILVITGMHTGRPVIPGVPFADMAGGGVFPALVMIAAQLGREKTGKGQYIDVAMTDVMTSFNIPNIASALSQRAGQEKRPYNVVGGSLCYNTFRTKDGKFISIGDLESKFWENFCRSIEREDLLDKQYCTYQDGEESTESLKAIFLSKTQSEWVEFIKNVDDCFAAVHTLEETLDDPHLIERGMITKMEDPIRGETVQIGFPAFFSDELHYKRSPAPTLGEHTAETLDGLGYSQEEIKTLKESGVI
ncbi:MAG: CaiB/BaiF CoA-transferase family protein, partial [Desulfatiglandales bacterium]